MGNTDWLKKKYVWNTDQIESNIIMMYFGYLNHNGIRGIQTGCSENNYGEYGAAEQKIIMENTERPSQKYL